MKKNEAIVLAIVFAIAVCATFLYSSSYAEEKAKTCTMQKSDACKDAPCAAACCDKQKKESEAKVPCCSEEKKSENTCPHSKKDGECKEQASSGCPHQGKK